MAYNRDNATLIFNSREAPINKPELEVFVMGVPASIGSNQYTTRRPALVPMATPIMVRLRHYPFVIGHAH
jgi:hypothetical protein